MFFLSKFMKRCKSRLMELWWQISGSPVRQRQDDLFPTNGRVMRKASIVLQDSTFTPTAHTPKLFTAVFIILTSQAKYDAWEEDIAIVNIFFGKETVVGHLHLSSWEKKRNISEDNISSSSWTSPSCKETVNIKLSKAESMNVVKLLNPQSFVWSTKIVLLRDGAKRTDDLGWLLLITWRTLWTLSWV